MISKIIFNSYVSERKGDSIEEVEAVREYIKSAKVIVVPTTNYAKFRAINEVLELFGLNKAEMLKIDTKFADYTRMPALAKALMALDACECDLVIARGRLGVPGSGAMLVLVDFKGRLLTAALSQPHVLHGMSVEEAVKNELEQALRRIGFERNHE